MKLELRKIEDSGSTHTYPQKKGHLFNLFFSVLTQKRIKVVLENTFSEDILVDFRKYTDEFGNGVWILFGWISEVRKEEMVLCLMEFLGERKEGETKNSLRDRNP